MTPWVTPDAEPLPDDIDALRAALVAERTARHEAEARAAGAEAMIAHLKLMIARLQRDRFGPTSERSRRLLDQLELQLEELEANGSEDEARQPEPVGDARRPAPRARPVRGPLPAHLPRERVVIAGPTTCPCCHGTLSKLGESVTETLEVIPLSTAAESWFSRTLVLVVNSARTQRCEVTRALPLGDEAASSQPGVGHVVGRETHIRCA